MSMRCNKDCLNCVLPKCKYDIEDQPEIIDSWVRQKKREVSKRWDAEHRERNRQRSKAWYEANREAHNARMKARYWEKKNERKQAKQCS